MPKKKLRQNGIIQVVVVIAAAFIFYYGLSFVLQTPLPLVTVVSGSMYHETLSFDSWWQQNAGEYEKLGISAGDFQKFPLRSGLSVGDLLLTAKADYKAGDVAIYLKNRITIVHRIVEVRDNGYVFKGDNNAGPDSEVISKERVIGKVVLAIPVLGYPRLALFTLGI
ncbi:signal peptidase I [Candidatus Woesearchaeota archaeon]|nr:signal peptidase I [Candidatus Woesearchaeota archaeon]